MTPVFAVAIICLIWEATVNPFVGTSTIVILVVLGFLGVYALLVYFTIKPDWEKLKLVYSIWPDSTTNQGY